MLASVLGCVGDEATEGALWEEAYENAEDMKGDLGGCNGTVPPDRSGFDRRIALTFDDGPGAHTRRVMEILRRYDAPATFFIKGSNASSANEPILEEIVTDPLFILGNHTWSHPNMKTLGESSAAREVDRTTEVIVAAGGEPSFFRFPYGLSNCMTARVVRSRGYHVTGWHIDTADWCYAAGGGYCSPSTFAYVDNDVRGDMRAWVLRQARSTGGGILLFHDIHANTVNNLEGIVQALRAEGFTFTGLDDASTFPLLNGVTPGSGFIGDACESEGDCGFAGAFCLPEGEIAGGYCTKSCTSTCPDRAGYPTTRCVEAPDENGAVSNLCAISCSGQGSCRDGLSCESLASPAGADRDVCWAPQPDGNPPNEIP